MNLNNLKNILQFVSFHGIVENNLHIIINLTTNILSIF